MIKSIKPRHPQTKVKHLILDRYLGAWGSIIIHGLKSQPTVLHLVYIDCNASYGRFAGELEDKITKREVLSVYGSPIIGVNRLDSLTKWAKDKYGKVVRTSSILIEKDPKIFHELKQSLSMAGLDHRVKETDNFSALKNGEIALLCEDSTLMASKLVSYTQSGSKFSFFLLDPYGPTGIPLSFVSEIIRHRKHDVIINMPYQDLHKKSGIVTKLNLGSAEIELVRNYDEMFGNNKWQNIARQLDPNAIWEEEESPNPSDLTVTRAAEARDLEEELITCYKESLQSADPDLTVKSMKLRFPDKERTMYYLYLTTHDPTGALQMNKVLSEAWQQEHVLRWDLKQSKKHEKLMMMPLFEVPAPPLETPQRASTEEIANHIVRLLKGKSSTRKGIYRILANEPYFADEINKALNSLKKQKRASFDDAQGINTRITIMD